MPRRLQSPSSINMYKQCARKYFYRYLKRLPTKPSIHLVRGSVAHKVLEDFYDLEVDDYDVDIRMTFMQAMIRMLKQYWDDSASQLAKLDMEKEEIAQFYEETQLMLINWFEIFWEKFQKQIKLGLSQSEAFKKVTPKREALYKFMDVGIQGYIDVIEYEGDEVNLMDYKTSKKFKITPEYELQLAIYAFMYHRQHGVMPTRAGIYFLKHGVLHLDVNMDLVKWAEKEIKEIHELTDTSDIDDYPKTITPLCKWRSGQCDFYDACFPKNEQKGLNEY